MGAAAPWSGAGLGHAAQVTGPDGHAASTAVPGAPPRPVGVTRLCALSDQRTGAIFLMARQRTAAATASSRKPWLGCVDSGVRFHVDLDGRSVSTRHGDHQVSDGRWDLIEAAGLGDAATFQFRHGDDPPRTFAMTQCRVGQRACPLRSCHCSHPFRRHLRSVMMPRSTPAVISACLGTAVVCCPHLSGHPTSHAYPRHSASGNLELSMP